MKRERKVGSGAVTAALLSFTVMSFGSSGHALAASEADRIAAIVDKAIEPAMKEHGVPGMAVAVTIDGKRYFRNYGVASKEGNVPVTENTLFELGSVSKTFTATLGAYAQVTGRLSLEDHPGKYIPELQGSAIDKAKLLHLASYTAGGLPLQFPDGVGNDRQMLAYFKGWKPKAGPGEQRRYSNPSIGFFGHITGIAMERDFREVMEAELFPKLGLSHSYIQVPSAAMKDYAWGHNKAGKPVRVNPGMFAAEAYGVKSSTSDMVRFVEANIEPDKLDGAVAQAVEGTHVGYFRVGEMVQGLGWEQYPYPVTLERLLAGNAQTMAMDTHSAKALTPPQQPVPATLYNKTGSTGGFGAYVAFVPEEKIGIVMLANRNLPIPARIKAAHTILEQLAGQTE